MWENCLIQEQKGWWQHMFEGLECYRDAAVSKRHCPEHCPAHSPEWQHVLYPLAASVQSILHLVFVPSRSRYHPCRCKRDWDIWEFQHRWENHSERRAQGSACVSVPQIPSYISVFHLFLSSSLRSHNLCRSPWNRGHRKQCRRE